jgi:Coenzyme PQQ synthesis protein D (PqqD)
MRDFPTARTKDLIIEELADEVLVYDLTTDKAHCLNRMSALIWKNCDGGKTESELAAILQRELGTPTPTQVVKLGLEELAGHGLLQEDAFASPGKRVSRRRLIQNLGLSAALALPLVMSISAPAAAGAESTTNPCVANPRGIGCPCTSDLDCDSFNCNAGVCGPELRPAR